MSFSQRLNELNPFNLSKERQKGDLISVGVHMSAENIR